MCTLFTNAPVPALRRDHGAGMRQSQWRDLRFEIEEFNIDYAHTLDEGDLATWPDFFTADGFYRITSRENADAGLPIGLVYCDGRGMLIDRIRAVMKTTMHEPRYLRHYNSNVRVLDVDAEGAVRASANYLVVELVVETLMAGETRILQAGRYDDTFVREDGRLLLKARDCIYDTLKITNALIYPV